MRWRVAAVALLLCVLDARSAWSGAFIIREDEFKPSNKEYPECRRSKRAPTSIRVMEFPPGAPMLEIVALDDRTHCIIYRSQTDGRPQALTIADHRFAGVYVNDVMGSGHALLVVIFGSSPSSGIAVAIVDEKFVVGPADPSFELPGSPGIHR